MKRRNETLLDAALAYAKRGFAVFPSAPGGKTPIHKGGFKNATTDPEAIRRWWTKHPEANIGCATGAASGITVLDVDVKKGKDGEASLRSLVNGPRALPPTLEARTPSGGRHLIFTGRDIHCSADKLGTGLDVRGEGGYIVVAPSKTVLGRYEWLNDLPPAPLRQVDPAIPAGFDRTMDRALAKRPQDRYQTAAELASDLRNYRSLAGGIEFEKTQPQPILPAQAAAEAQQMRSQLLEDLDQFAKNFEAQEQQRLRDEAEARRRKEPALQAWGSAEEKRRAAFERGDRPAPEDPGALTTTRRLAAVEILRQQAAFRKSQAEARLAAGAALDGAMRAALQYLGEFAKEMNEHTPRSGASYEFIYVGKIASVTLGQATVASRMLKLAEGNELCAQIHFHFWARPAEPAKFMLLGEDVDRCEQYLRSLGVEFQQRSRDGSRERPVQFVVTGALPCEVNISADFEAATATLELINVRRFGRLRVRLATQAFRDAIDDLARYVLGVDDDFRKLIPDT